MKFVANQKRVFILSALVLVTYTGSYARLRVVGELTHYENKSDLVKGHEIKAPNDAWLAHFPLRLARLKRERADLAGAVGGAGGSSGVAVDSGLGAASGSATC